MSDEDSFSLHQFFEGFGSGHNDGEFSSACSVHFEDFDGEHTLVQVSQIRVLVQEYVNQLLLGFNFKLDSTDGDCRIDWFWN